MNVTLIAVIITAVVIVQLIQTARIARLLNPETPLMQLWRPVLRTGFTIKPGKRLTDLIHIFTGSLREKASMSLNVN